MKIANKIIATLLLATIIFQIFLLRGVAFYVLLIYAIIAGIAIMAYTKQPHA
jgi:Flp pilus assembly protein protease CpaA